MNRAASPDLSEAYRMAATEPNPNDLPWGVWGGLIWRESLALKHDDRGDVNYVVTIRLRRNDESAFAQLRDGRFLGDSELSLSDVELQREFSLPAREPVGLTHVLLKENERDRLGSIILSIAACPNPFTAYRVSQTVFNTVAVAAGVQCHIPLRWNCTLIVRETVDEVRQLSYHIVAPVSYPDVAANLSFEMPPALARLYSNYVEGLRANSPFYSFLCFFALVEIITGRLQGQLRQHADRNNIAYRDLNGALTREDVGRTAPVYVGMTYAELLRATRPLRDAVAHFIITRVPRPFNVADEDNAHFAREALKVACRNLLEAVTDNYQRFAAAGMNGDDLLRLFETARPRRRER